MCIQKQKKLCGKEECNICLDRSFDIYKGKTENGKLKKENYDMADAVATVIGFINMNNLHVRIILLI